MGPRPAAQGVAAVQLESHTRRGGIPSSSRLEPLLGVVQAAVGSATGTVTPRGALVYLAQCHGHGESPGCPGVASVY